MYIFTSDPGHGWLRVPVSELKEMGIADKISPYSYISENGRFAYLEAHRDFMMFMNIRVNSDDVDVQRLWINENIKFKTVERTNIRQLPSYNVA